MHPILNEIMRAKLPVRPDVLLRWQRAIRDEIGPDLDRLALLTDLPEPKPRSSSRKTEATA